MYCPFCFASLTPDIMVCKNPGCEMYEQSMPVKKPRLRTKLPDGIRVRFSRLLADRMTKCEACRLPGVTICGSCGREIPSAWTRYPEKSILFLGQSGAGKSTLLAASRLKLSERSDLLMTPLEPVETGERFYSLYTGPLTREQRDLDPTAPEIPRPFLWGVSSRRGRITRAMALAVYDVAGELQSTHEKVVSLETLLGRASGICLVIDPTIQAARQADKSGTPAFMPDPGIWESGERLLDEVLNRGDIGGKSGVRVAVVFTHLDIWFASVPDCADTDALSDILLRRLVGEWRGKSFLARLNEFSDNRLFATGLYRGEELRPLDGAEAPLAYLMGEKYHE